MNQEQLEKAAENILEEANRLVGGIKRQDYGDALECCEKIARVWSAILGHAVTAEEVALCMVGLKVIRETQGSKRDNVVDIAGYARVLEMVKEGRIAREKELNRIANGG